VTRTAYLVPAALSLGCALSLVVRERVTPVSIDIASTRAPTRGLSSGPVIFPVRMSVVLPTCARAVTGNESAARRAIPAKEVRKQNRGI